MKTGTEKRTALLLLAVILLVSVTANFVFAEDGLTPGINEAAENSGDTNFIKYRDNYSLDTEKISFFKNPMSTTFDGAANGLFAMQKGIATVQIYIFQIALESNILELLEEFITPFIDSMRNFIFEGFSLFFISICALLLLLKLAVNRQAQAISGLFQILLIVTLAFIFYNHPVDMMKAAGDVTKGVSDAVMEGPYNAVNGSSTDTSMEGKVSALVWNLMVHKPWQTAEFGSIEKAREYEGEILKLTSESDERKELVEKLAKEQGLFSKSLTHQLERVFTLLVLGVMNLLIFLFLTAFCVLIVGYQFLILIYMLLGVFVFLLALIPYFSIELVKRWTFRILSACGTKILLVFFLSLLLVFIDAMYQFIDTQGLLFTLFMIIVIISMIYIKRKEILGLFTGFRAGDLTVPAAYQTMNRALDKDLNMVHNLNAVYTMRKRDRQEAGAFSGSLRQSNPEEHMGSSRESSGSGRKTASGFSANAAMEGARSEKNAQSYSQESAGGELKTAAGSIARSTQDMSRYFKKAEDLLQKQYEKSKTEAEETAERKGTEPEYGDFIRRTDAVRSLGAGSFDQRDVSSLARILQLVEKKGGNIDNVVADSAAELHHEVRRPANLFDRSMNSGEAAPGTEPSGQTMAQKSQKFGIEYFKETFGEEKGEDFYSAMTRKYDAVTVDRFGSSEKLTYAQVQRQLKEREKEKHRELKMKEQAVQMKKPGEEHGKEKR